MHVQHHLHITMKMKDMILPSVPNGTPNSGRVRFVVAGLMDRTSSDTYNLQLGETLQHVYGLWVNPLLGAVPLDSDPTLFMCGEL